MSPLGAAILPSVIPACLLHIVKACSGLFYFIERALVYFIS